jgi:hypothetical protein
MKNQDEIRAEFEGWTTNNVYSGMHPKSITRLLSYNVELQHYTKPFMQARWHAWQSCQQLNDERIAAKDAEIAELKDCKIALKALWNAKQMKENNYSGYEQAKIRAWDLAKKALEEGKGDE